MRSLSLVMAALLPAIILSLYIYKKDRVEKEPVRLLFALLLGGVACCYPAAVIEGFLLDIINKGVLHFYLLCEEYINPQAIYTINKVLENFIGIALVEEGLKLLVLLRITKKHSEFNSIFDGIVYAVFVSLGFAAFENILYVLQYGFSNALMRAVTSVPGHTFFGVMMGYYYSFLHIADKTAETEEYLKSIDAVPQDAKNTPKTGLAWMMLSVPVFAHGLYDYCCTYGTPLAVFVFYTSLIGMYVYCFLRIKQMSADDAPVNFYVRTAILRKHPKLAEPIQNGEIKI